MAKSHACVCIIIITFSHLNQELKYRQVGNPKKVTMLLERGNRLWFKCALRVCLSFFRAETKGQYIQYLKSKE